MTNGELSAEFANPVVPGLMETGTLVVWLILFIYCWRQSKRAGELTFGMLVLLSAMSMHWLEWYADWGAYLLYNPKFALMPWGSTWWTSPNKPWFMPFSYGWFYYGVVFIMLALIAKFKARNPGLGHVASVFIVAYPIFYIWDVVLEMTASMTGWWVYVYNIGPTISLAMGNFPYLHPFCLYALSGVLLCLSMSYRNAGGRIWFESFFGLNRLSPGMGREAARLLVWCIFMNLLYMTTFVIPLNLIREYVNVPNAFVP